MKTVSSKACLAAFQHQPQGRLQQNSYQLIF